MNVQFNMKNGDKEMKNFLKAGIKKISADYGITDMKYDFKKGKEDVVTVSPQIDLKDKSKNFNDIGEENNEEQRILTTEVGLDIASEFSKLNKDAKLRLYLGQEHSLLEPKDIAIAQQLRKNKDDALTHVWGQKIDPKTKKLQPRQNIAA